MKVPYGYCHCGCGEKTKLAKETAHSRGHIKGQPLRYIHTHHARVPLEVRFWEKVVRKGANDCWLWTAATDNHGYGQIMLGSYRSANKRPHKAHRVAWELMRGPIPDGMLVCHRCDNPRCCNPSHLFLGDQRANMRDASDKGRIRGQFVPGPKGTRHL